MGQPTDAEIARDLRMFGRNLCAAREQIAPDQKAFARLAILDRSAISKIECGKQAPNFDTFLIPAQAARVKPSELLFRVGPEQAPRGIPNHECARPATAAASFGANLKWAREQAGLSHEQRRTKVTAARSLSG